MLMSRVFLFDSLRAHLKARGLTYSQVAEGLDVSEVTIKRIFASNDCSIERLEQMCEFLQLELKDLVKRTPKRRQLIEHLTAKQEEELASNKKLLMVAVCVMALWTFDDMCAYLRMTNVECVRLLNRLDALGFIEVRPKHQYRLLVARDFSWIRGGPIMRLVKGFSTDYFDHHFEGEGEVLKIINVRVSPEVRETLKAKLEQIAQQYADQVAVDSHLPLSERPPLSICIAVRQWVPDFLRELMREDTK